MLFPFSLFILYYLVKKNCMLSSKATAAVSDVMGSCYWLVAITWSLRPTIQTIINVRKENSPAGDYREHAQANFRSLTASPQTNFRLAFSQVYCIHITVDLTILWQLNGNFLYKLFFQMLTLLCFFSPTLTCT